MTPNEQMRFDYLSNPDPKTPSQLSSDRALLRAQRNIVGKLLEYIDPLQYD